MDVAELQHKGHQTAEPSSDDILKTVELTCTPPPSTKFELRFSDVKCEIGRTARHIFI